MNIPIYDGNPVWNANAVPFGFYSSDTEFQADAVKVTKFCATRLGYPLMDVELQSGSFFTAFEEATTTYGNELYAYKIRDNQLSLEGLTTGSNLNTTLVTPNFAPIVRLSEQYGEEAGTGGNVTWYSGSIAMTQSQQEYDLKKWATDNNITGGIEIKRVFYENVPASTQFYDPYVGSGFGFINLMSSFGFGALSPAINFLLMPLNYDLAIIQQIEMNDMVRRSNYSFELINNKIRIFPIPNKNEKLHFKYILKSDRDNPYVSGSLGVGVVTDISTVPYTNPTYANINSIGRQWVFEYTLALAKEMLGYVRGKYSTVPIPGADVTLNQSDLISAATAEKTALIERLRTYLEETSRTKLLEKKANEAEFLQKDLASSPYSIYIG